MNKSKLISCLHSRLLQRIAVGIIYFYDHENRKHSTEQNYLFDTLSHPHNASLSEMLGREGAR